MSMRSGVALALASSLLLVAPPVGADRTRDRVEELYLQSLEDYDNLRLDDAKVALRDALRAASRARIRDTLVAKIHVHMGQILYVETKDPYLAEEEFVKALSIDPGIRLDPLNATPSLEKAFDDARSRIDVAPGPSDPLGGAPTGSSGVVHEPVDRAYSGVNIPIYVEVPRSMPVHGASLHFRSEAGNPYASVDLEPSGGRGFSGYIPAEEVFGAGLEYYISLIDRRGVEVGSAATARDPYPIRLLRGGSEALGAVPEALVMSSWASSRDRSPVRRRSGHLLVGMGGGAGFILGGPLRDKGFETTAVDPGIADSTFHAYTELGFYPADDLLLLVSGRFQFLLPSEKGKDTRIIPSPAVRLRYFYDPVSPIRQFIGFGGGMCDTDASDDGNGCVENRVNLDDQDYTATAHKGPYHAGVEGGFAFGSGSSELVVMLQAYGLFPRTSFQLDLNMGLGISF